MQEACGRRRWARRWRTAGGGRRSGPPACASYTPGCTRRPSPSPSSEAPPSCTTTTGATATRGKRTSTTTSTRSQGLRFRREAFSRLSPGTGNRPVPGENRQKPDGMALQIQKSGNRCFLTGKPVTATGIQKKNRCIEAKFCKEMTPFKQLTCRKIF